MREDFTGMDFSKWDPQLQQKVVVETPPAAPSPPIQPPQPKEKPSPPKPTEQVSQPAQSMRLKLRGIDLPGKPFMIDVSQKYKISRLKAYLSKTKLSCPPEEIEILCGETLDDQTPLPQTYTLEYIMKNIWKQTEPLKLSFRKCAP